MKKVLAAFGVGLIGSSAALWATGNGFLLKAVFMNLKRGAFTPSIDDAERFPCNMVYKSVSEPWEKSKNYNTLELPEEISEQLEKTRSSALLIFKDGQLEYEKYWKKHHPHSLMNSFSMAKGILSLMVGACIDDHYITSENQLFSDFYPRYKAMEFGKHLTLKHLMTMQAGLDWAEEYKHPFAPNSKQYFVDDVGEQVFERDLIEMPGTRYEYQSAAPQLLGFAVRRATGKTLSEYLTEKIWSKLGMECDAKWSTDENGMEKTFCCIHASARDFGKIGQLLLNRGKWNGETIISADYIDRMVEPTKQNDAFGYTVWANDEAKVKYRFLYGFLGQFIIIVPEKNMVIVKMGHFNRLEVDEKLRPLQVQMFAEQLSAAL